MTDEDLEGLEMLKCVMDALHADNVKHLEEKITCLIEVLIEVARVYEDKITDMQATMRLMVGKIEYLEAELEEPK